MSTDRLMRAVPGAVVLLLAYTGGMNAVWAQSATIVSGRVANESGEPIANATVGIVNSTIMTLTSADGRYTLSVPGSRRGETALSARTIGYARTQQSVMLAGAPVALNWTLTRQATQLTGMVITALSAQREKATIGTAQQSLTGDDLTKVPSPNLISAMSGKVSGVTINQSGNMGGSSRIVIRGQGSILGENQPLFIVDGIPVSNTSFSTATTYTYGGRDYGTAISDINADDIASMTVLKGPNAAALYGSRAANGAIVITTKSGRDTPSGTRVTFSSRFQADQPSIFPTYQNQYGQGFGGAFSFVDGAGSGVNDGADESWGPKLDGRLIDQFNGKQLPWVARPDNVRDYFRTGTTVSNNVNVTTSAPGIGARMSITKENTAGIVPNSSLSKLSAVLSASGQYKERLTLGGNFQYVQSGGNNRPENGYTEGNPFMGFTWFGRQVDLQALKKQFFNRDSPYGFEDGSLYNWNLNYHRNPHWQFAENSAPDSRDRIIASTSAIYQFTSWLTGTIRGGSDSYRQSQDQHFARGNIDNTDASFNGGFASFTRRSKESNVEGLLTVKRSLGMLDVGLTGGGNIRKNETFINSYGTRGILVEKIYNLANAGIAPTVTNEEYRSAVNSAYGSVVVTLNQLWTVEATGRNDWSSTLPKANASYFYPSVSSSLIVSDLFPALKRGDWITYAKLRGGFAQVGSAADPYQLQTLYVGQSDKFGGAPLYSLDNTLANAFLRPERTTGAEGGVEVSLFGDRVTVDATYYTKTTKDQIIPLTLSPATGFERAVVNAGQITNRGVEALVTVRPVRGTNFEWTSTVSYARNRSRVDELAPGLSTIIVDHDWGANIEARAGEPYGVLFGYGYLRDSASGQLLLADGLPQRAGEKSILGNVNPDYTGGWANEVRYKNFSLNVLVDRRQGGQNFSVGNWWGTYTGVLASTLPGREVDWDDPGLVVQGIDQLTGEANTTRVTAEDYNHSIYPIHERAIFSTGFTKLREVRVAWNASPSVASKFRLSQLNLALIGRNLYTWSKFPNYDPENSTSAGNAGQGFDMGSRPTARSFGVNVTITP